MEVKRFCSESMEVERSSDIFVHNPYGSKVVLLEPVRVPEAIFGTETKEVTF